MMPLSLISKVIKGCIDVIQFPPPSKSKRMRRSNRVDAWCQPPFSAPYHQSKKTRNPPSDMRTVLSFGANDYSATDVNSKTLGVQRSISETTLTSRVHVLWSLCSRLSSSIEISPYGCASPSTAVVNVVVASLQANCFSGGRVENWRAHSRLRWLPHRFRGGPQSGCHRHVSSSRHVERSGPISGTTLSCLLHLKGYETYQAERAFGVAARRTR
jgi:hypothetical protein